MMKKRSDIDIDYVDIKRQHDWLARNLSQALELLQRFVDHAEEDLSGFYIIGPTWREEVEDFLADQEEP